MERDLYQKLIEWKQTGKRKPLALLGARQTGKTWLLKEFGAREFENTIYFNFEEEPRLDSFFAASLAPERILEQLSLYRKTAIRPGRDLLIFDEIQASNNALAALKYFCETMPELHLAAAGSLLGLKTSIPKTFPVGKVDLLTLHPLTFPEFLTAAGAAGYRAQLATITAATPLPEPIHDELVLLLKKYYLAGGMPEATACFLETGSWERTRKIQTDILKAYVFDFAKHAPATDIPKLSRLWDSIPTHLARENKRFIFTAVARSARGREYADALQWLDDAGLIRRVYAVESARVPLAGHADRSIFKVYLLDTGLLAAMARLDPALILEPEGLFTTWHGAFVENYAAQQLAALRDSPLYYWKSASHKAEVDFLLDEPRGALPLEVKAGINPRSKSLRAYADRFAPPLLLRTTLLNFRRDGAILNIPLYALGELPRFLVQNRTQNGQ